MKPKIRRIYCDTSVFGGAFDKEFERASRLFFDIIRRNEFQIIISPVVDAEINDPMTPVPVRQLYTEFLAFSEIIDVNAQAYFLQEEYIKHNVLTSKWTDDALHVALATVHSCDMIVSWNFRHIVN